MEEKDYQLKINTAQISLLIFAILISFFSLYTLFNVRKNLQNINQNPSFSAEKNGLIISLLTFILIFFYWLLAYKQYKDETDPITKESIKINVCARTLILIAVTIDLYQAYRRYNGISNIL